MNHTETIAAISTAMNNSGIGIVRISGDDAFDIIKKIFRPYKKKDLDEVSSHTVHYETILDGEEIVDEVLVLFMKAPHTYTRENTVEIDCHGGIYVLKKTLELVIRNGARPAEPGEFTKRAFMNGRIDLSQAEAVIDVINAENDFALKSALTQLKGSVSEKIRKERAVLLEQIAYIEAALDDPEHIEMEGYGEVLLPILNQSRSEITKLLESADDGRIIKEGIRTVILGKPNVGKSSLLNALMGQERAIVTDIAGTTRDAIEESIRLKDVTLNIIDTAGIRDTQDIIEKIGVDKAREYAKEADLIIFVIDVSKKLDSNDYEILEIIKEKKAVVLFNKQDLPVEADLDGLKAELENIPVIETSITNNQGLDELSEMIRDMFYKQEINFNDQVYITNVRQKNDLQNAEQSLKKAMDSIEAGMPEDFFTIDMMDAYTSLGAVIGEAIEDDLADEIFSKFCMGK
ncbi:MAG: tRNA uridine-5-carboxymethylaminomethyl(34) synthesis GTPase MnmE [Erysipelotrichaceae bacterium]|nr:tRNA uridine-5-carboxymethylaminomethyl(34) synthesis GTPase MnmE [Erysipelotrichaceae bacterium]